ncbi:hydroxyacid dehydrogenase [Labrys monachus]|uniref:D-3-phosphoglycerate dehydrogenase n=1 Tax=Labrys monachus TaxID=217067 RepID=A0ABU0FGZ5_9HYPH|nr:hydroxyacid dehydrogenase [Labrys monachus]MDQ0393878.1 D-3-phosphoglycerate dehydrogenase [Labrys monachus]
MESCLIVQPIHDAGPALLREAGLRPFTPQEAQPADWADCVAAITRNAGFTAQQMDACPRLRVVGVHGVGTDAVDIVHADRSGIVVVNTPGTNTLSVAEHAIALMFALAKRIPASDQATRQGDFAFKFRGGLVELQGLTFGIVGMGNIGRATAALAHALGMRVLALSRRSDDVGLPGIERVTTLDELLAASDVVSLHLPATAQTVGLIGRRELGLMRRSAFLINTGRGAVIDEPALIEALAAGTIAGAGLDVFASEAMPADYPLLALPNVVLTPHSAASTEASLRRMAIAVAQGVLDVVQGRRPPHMVNPTTWSIRRGVAA